MLKQTKHFFFKKQSQKLITTKDDFVNRTINIVPRNIHEKPYSGDVSELCSDRKWASLILKMPMNKQLISDKEVLPFSCPRKFSGMALGLSISLPNILIF